MAPLKFSISLFEFLLYCLTLLLLLSSYFPEKTQAIGSPLHNIEVTSLLTASVCSRQTSTDFNTRKYSTTLEVVDKHGPCSLNHQEHTKNKPSLADILSHDQSRVDSIQARSKQHLLRNQYKNNKASLPVQLGVPLDTLNYVVTVGLGTPQQNVTLIFDTGSEQTWTQCKPCIGHCYPQRGHVYNPHYSRTYSNIPCNSSECSNFGFERHCQTGPCVYNITYGDGSYSVGMLSKEKLTITPNTDDVFSDFIFGCGQKNIGIFGKTAGLLGLSKDPHNASFLYQTATKYDRYFSYCLPSTGSSTGYLAFGRSKSNNPAKNVKFTSLVPHPYFYLIDIVAISVGGARLPISSSVFQNSGFIVDSGTVVTRLPQDAYVELRDAFKKKIGHSYRSAPTFDQFFDTCYYTTNGIIKVPSVSFTFGGGVEVKLDHSGIIYALNSTLACLAFKGNTDPNDYGIFGNTQQKTLEVVYDVAGEKLGFGPGGCK